MTRAELVDAYVERLEQGMMNPNDQNVFAVPGDLGVRMAQVATRMANHYAIRDPMLGNGRDVRAVYALALGLSVSAAIMLDLMANTEQGE